MQIAAHIPFFERDLKKKSLSGGDDFFLSFFWPSGANLVIIWFKKYRHALPTTPTQGLSHTVAIVGLCAPSDAVLIRPFIGPQIT